MTLLKKILFLFVSICFVLNTYSQVTSVSARASLQTQYQKYDSSMTQEDFIFIFNGQIGAANIGAVTAESPDTVVNPSSYTWYIYNFSLNNWDSIIKTETGVLYSTINNLGFGYYKVHYVTQNKITLKTTNATIYFWVLFNYPPTVHVTITEYRCSVIQLKAAGVIDTMYYYLVNQNHYVNINKKIDVLKFPLSAKWERNQTLMTAGSGKYYSTFSSPPPGGTIFTCNDYPSPADTTTYTAIITDRFNNSSQPASVKFNTPISTRANFTYKIENLSGSGQGTSPYAYSFAAISDTGSSSSSSQGGPLGVQFTNHSLNGVKFLWQFIDSMSPDARLHEEPKKLRDTITYDTIVKPQFVYYGKGTYKPSLISYPKPYGPGLSCPSDTFPSSANAGSSDSSISIPTPTIIDKTLITNVFTPGNDDGLNDKYWFNLEKFKDQSVKGINISVYSRGGLRVFYYDGPPTFEANPNDYSKYPGWDGTIGNGGKIKCPAGAYFYTIIITDWNDDPPDKFNGTLYLIRKP